MKVHDKLVINDFAEMPLVAFRQKVEGYYKRGKRMIFITVSPNPSTRHSINIDRGYSVHKPRAMRAAMVKNIKVEYKHMPHAEQYKYLFAYINDVYLEIMEHEDFMYIVYEINGDGNLHAHALLYSNTLQDEYDLAALRKQVFCHYKTQANTKRGGRDYMNNIVYLEESKISDVIEYLMKDQQIKNKFPDYNIEK